MTVLDADITTLDVDAIVNAANERMLDAAAEVGARTVAFPAISTGVYGYPAGLAACDATASCLDWLAHPGALDRVVLVAHGPRSAEVLRGAVDRTAA